MPVLVAVAKAASICAMMPATVTGDDWTAGSFSSAISGATLDGSALDGREEHQGIVGRGRVRRGLFDRLLELFEERLRLRHRSGAGRQRRPQAVQGAGCGGVARDCGGEVGNG